MPETRKLATIMSVDVAGYSRMAEASDSVAADAVARLKEALARIATPHAGRIFNTAGDGVMLEFPVASAGVHAALQLLDETKAGELPRVRVGLHLGEVIVADNGDLLGHGVNVAARLQALAAPGTAMVSQAVHAQMRSASSIAFTPHGRVHLDKMAETMEVFTLAASGAKPRASVKLRMRQTLRPLVLATAAALVLLAATLFLLTRGPTTEVASTTAPQNGAPRLAVLRFETLGDTEGYFAEGVADELISEASRIPGLEVTARASSFALTGGRQTPANAGSELGATLVLTGAVRSSSDAIRVNAQLSEAPSGRLIWNRSFERPNAESYALQRDIAVDVARAAGLRATAAPRRQADPEAFRLYLHGREVWSRRIDGHVEEARDFFRAATERDAGFADAWAWLARTEYNVAERANYDAGPGHELTQEKLADARQFADRALALDPSLPIPYQILAAVFSNLGQWREEAAAAKAAEARGGVFSGGLIGERARASIAPLRRATELNPLDQSSFAGLGYTCYLAGDFACAVKAEQRALELEPRYGPSAFNLFMAQIQSGDREGARHTLETRKETILNWFATDPTHDLRFMKAVIGDGPPVSTSELKAMLDAGKAHLDDVISVLALTGRAREAAALLPRWGSADRQYLNELIEPGLAELRATPEFWATMEREGLLRFWRESGKWPDFCAVEPCPK